MKQQNVWLVEAAVRVDVVLAVMRHYYMNEQHDCAACNCMIGFALKVADLHPLAAIGIAAYLKPAIDALANPAREAISIN